jgi:hypothetical protein
MIDRTGAILWYGQERANGQPAIACGPSPPLFSRSLDRETSPKVSGPHDASNASYTLVKDATAEYSEEFMHAALVTNLPNYASAVVTTQEVTDALLGNRPLAQSSSAMGNTRG